MKQQSHKNFAILILGQIISLFGSSIQRFALSLYLLDLTGSASIFASILAISMIPIVVIAPVAGILADRGDKKKLMIILDSLSGVLLVWYLFMIGNPDHQVLLVAVVMVALSAISTIYQPVVSTCIPILVKEEEMVRANAWIQQVASLSNFLGPIFAGLLYGFLGIKGVIIINLVSFFISAIMELLLNIPHEKKVETEPLTQVVTKDMKESFRYLKDQNPIVFRMLLFSGFYNLFLVPVFSVVAPYLLKVTFSLSSQVYGVAEGMIALGMILGGGLIVWKPNAFHIKRVYRLLYITSLSMAVMGVGTFFFQAGSISGVVAGVCFTLCGMVIMGIIGIANVLSSAYLYTAIEKTLLGKILAFGSAFATLCIPMGQVLFGGLVEMLSNRLFVVLYLAAIFVFGVTLLVRWNVLKIQE